MKKIIVVLAGLMALAGCGSTTPAPSSSSTVSAPIIPASVPEVVEEVEEPKEYGLWVVDDEVYVEGFDIMFTPLENYVFMTHEEIEFAFAEGMELDKSEFVNSAHILDIENGVIVEMRVSDYEFEEQDEFEAYFTDGLKDLIEEIPAPTTEFTEDWNSWAGAGDVDVLSIKTYAYYVVEEDKVFTLSILSLNGEVEVEEILNCFKEIEEFEKPEVEEPVEDEEAEGEETDDEEIEGEETETSEAA